MWIFFPEIDHKQIGKKYLTTVNILVSQCYCQYYYWFPNIIAINRQNRNPVSVIPALWLSNAFLVLAVTSECVVVSGDTLEF